MNERAFLSIKRVELACLYDGVRYVILKLHLLDKLSAEERIYKSLLCITRCYG